MMTDAQILEQLKRKYREEMVSALVGAGFTLNAYPKAMMWRDMLKDLVGEAYKEELQERYDQYCHFRHLIDVRTYEEMEPELIKKIIARDGYLSVVSKYIAQKGSHEAIDYYIEQHTPYFYLREDGTYGVKGDEEARLTAKDFTIHQRFLMGRWQYVFTTNYDNALEFVNDQFNMGFATIKADYEMSRKKMARPIVKVHGSLVPQDETLSSDYEFDGDHSRRYIISKEDYDTYMQRHEAFSYLLRVALLSGAYLLLGFSGDDPNFKAWLGWVKDILDKDNGRRLCKSDTDNESEEDYKVYLVLTDDKEIPIEQQLYYRNHHIGVIHLTDKEVLFKIKCSANATTQIALDHLLHYLIGDKENNDKDTTGQEETRTLATLWRDLYEKMSRGKSYSDTLNEIRVKRKEQPFIKGTALHDYIVDVLRKKETLNDNEREVLGYVVEDLGWLSGSLEPKMKEALETQESWQQTERHELTLKGDSERIEGESDAVTHENVMRALYQLDFATAKKLLAEWEPKGKYRGIKASLNYWYDRNGSLRQLDSVILNSESEIEQYVASFLYNCIHSGFSAYHSLNKFRNKGMVGLNDEIQWLTERLRAQNIKFEPYGTETVVYHADGERDEFRREREFALRLIQVMSKEGFNLCYGIMNMVDVNDWYLAFRRLYIYLPIPCFYYSCQYNNKSVLRRIGQDYAFDYGMKDVLPVLVKRVFAALKSEATPGVMLSGMLQISGQLFYGLNEETWFDDFEDYLKEVYVKEEGKYIYSSEATRFVRCALVCLYEPDHISRVLTVLLDYFEKQPDETLGMMIHALRMKKMERLTTEQQVAVEQLCSSTAFNDGITLMAVLKGAGLLEEGLRARFIEGVLMQKAELEKADRYTLYNFCQLSEGREDAVKVLKPIILKRNIWDCGTKDGWHSETEEFFIMHLGEQFVWEEDELRIIYKNLRDNLNLITESAVKGNPFFSSTYINLLKDMESFVGKYPQIAETGGIDEIRKKLDLAKRYGNDEDALYSDDADVVELISEDLDAAFRKGTFDEHRESFEIMMQKCSMMHSPGLSECLVSIAIALHFCKEKVSAYNKYEKPLYRLLLQYKGKDLRELDLQVIHAGHALLEIAKYLQQQGVDDENILWWLENENLKRLNYMEF